MERHSFQLGAVLLKAVLGTHGANPPPDPEDRSLDYLFEEVGNTTDSEFDPKNNSLDDARGFGIKIKKFQPIFEAPEEIQNARNKKGVEHAQRTEELQETETIHQQIEARYKLYDGKKTKEECREEIIAERLMKQGRYQKIENRGGVSLANVDTNQGGSK